jgi:MFS family permease
MVVDFSDTPDRPSDSEPKKGIQFWLIFVAISLATFLAALDTSIIFIALPTITESLKSEELYVWIIITYLLASTVSAPQFDQAADIFDRRSSTTIAIILLAVGNVLAGAAKNTGMMLAGRTVQGIGGGGVATPSEIIVCEMVSLRERGLYAGIIGSVWAIAAVVGPIIEGAFA